MSRFWTSDWHFGHANIIEYTGRPFFTEVFDKNASAFGTIEAYVPDVEAMNRALIRNCNEMVGESDELWLVGDAAMGRRETTVPLFKELRCRNLFLVPGNHDHVHRMFPKWMKHVALYEDAGFKIMNSQETVQIAGQDVMVCHFPFTGDSHSQDRYSAQRPDDVGQWLIHGHTHSTEALNGRMIHVGVDAHNLAPVAETWIEEVINRGTPSETSE